MQSLGYACTIVRKTQEYAELEIVTLKIKLFQTVKFN